MEHNNYLFLNISLLYRCGQKYYDKKLADYQIGAGQLSFLILIYENEGISMQQLAKKGCFDKGTITKSVQKLEELGYVHSNASKDDKRVRCLHTTQKAEEIITDIYMIRQEWWKRLTMDMDTNEASQFETSLSKLCEKARNYDEQDVDENDIKIFGLQKLTLLDYPGTMASTIFTGGCNFRCPFCHNSDLVFLPENTVEIQKQDILSFLRKRSTILEGVCISGGEPLLHDGLEALLRQIKELGYRVKLDTNGSHPAKLKHLVDESLVDFVAMDIKNSPKQYAKTIGLTTYDLSPIEESVRYLKEDHVPYEFRTTIVKEFHTKESIEDIGHWLSGDSSFYLQNFEDSEHVIQENLHSVEKDTLLQYLEVMKKYIPNTHTRGI